MGSIVLVFKSLILVAYVLGLPVLSGIALVLALRDKRARPRQTKVFLVEAVVVCVLWVVAMWLGRALPRTSTVAGRTLIAAALIALPAAAVYRQRAGYLLSLAGLLQIASLLAGIFLNVFITSIA